MLAAVEIPVAGGAYLLAWIVLGASASRRSCVVSTPVIAATTLALALAPDVGRCVLARPGRGLDDAAIASSLAAAWLTVHVILTGTVVVVGARRPGAWMVAGLLAGGIDHVLRWTTPWGPSRATAAITQVDITGRPRSRVRQAYSAAGPG